jgi:hypothetical protein
VSERQIRSTLSELYTLFLSVDERGWADIVSGFLRFPVLNCGYLKTIKASINGMGRMNDVYISKHNGHTVEDEQTANETLLNLTNKLWKQMVELQREFGC